MVVCMIFPLYTRHASMIGRASGSEYLATFLTERLSRVGLVVVQLTAPIRPYFPLRRRSSGALMKPGIVGVFRLRHLHFGAGFIECLCLRGADEPRGPLLACRGKALRPDL